MHSYLTGATSVANWIQTNAYDTSGRRRIHRRIRLQRQDDLEVDRAQPRRLLVLHDAGDRDRRQHLDHARRRTPRRSSPPCGTAPSKKFWVGTDPDGTSLNKGFLPEDVNTWTYLAFKDSGLRRVDRLGHGEPGGHRRRIHRRQLRQPATEAKVWFEGTAHLADALAVRNGSGDAAKAQGYLNSIQLAQTTAPQQQRHWASSPHRTTSSSDCDCDYYYAAPHTGATAWYLLAGTATDPFYLLPPTSVGNDFTLSASPASATLTAGSAASTTVTTATASGTAETVTLSASGLPSTTTAAFTPSSTTAGGSSTLTISTTASTPAGTYPITITGTAPSATHSTTFTLAVSGTNTGPALYQAESTANTITAPANVIACGSCSGGARIGHLGKQSTGVGTLRFNGVVAAGGAGKYQIVVAFTDGSASRDASISVNGGTAQTVTFGTTGSFSTPGNQTVALTLAAGTNTITFTNPSTAAPDIDAITVPATRS